ncbi:amidohydrolase family protein [Maribacter sp.]|nr:amidohydrolase family protein [Maribacter sp.]
MKTRRYIVFTITILLTHWVIGQQKNESISGSDRVTENYQGPIIDMHIHAYTEPIRMFGLENYNPLTKKTYVGSETLLKHQEETFEKFKKHNIVRAMVSNGAEWHAIDTSLVIIGEGRNNSIETLREKHKSGNLQVLGEIAPNYDGILPTDERLTPYFDLAEELEVPIAYHMYPGGPPGGAYFAYPKTRAFQGKPLQLEEILFSRPKMKMYIMHAGWPYLEDMKALMYAHPQVYVDLGVICWGIPRTEFHNFLKGLVDAGFGDRIMYGSDQMVWVTTIDEGIEAVNTADFLSQEQKENIFYNNAARFLNLTEAQIKADKGL